MRRMCAVPVSGRRLRRDWAKNGSSRLFDSIWRIAVPFWPPLDPCTDPVPNQGPVFLGIVSSYSFYGMEKYEKELLSPIATGAPPVRAKSSCTLIYLKNWRPLIPPYFGRVFKHLHGTTAPQCPLSRVLPLHGDESALAAFCPAISPQGGASVVCRGTRAALRRRACAAVQQASWRWSGRIARATTPVRRRTTRRTSYAA
eukprot:scaffold48_cov311-Pinguiococcus_pyrenoidosus.AAC.217